MTQVLDHGSVELVDSMASDQSVLRAMLISTGSDNLTDLMTVPPSGNPENPYLLPEHWETIKRNKGRINFLMREHHGTPFEHNAMIFRVVAPIFVVREWHRHRIGWSYNEISGRYTTLPDVWYIPERQNIRTRVGKPGRYHYEPLMHSVGGDESITVFQQSLERACYDSYSSYIEALKMGVAPEQARSFLHVNHYTSFYATCNARSLMNFLNLRGEGTTAQWEIQQYATALETEFAKLMPVTYECFVKNGRIAP